MSVSRRTLLTEARNIRTTLSGLSEQEIDKAVLEVLKCYNPFYTAEYLQDVINESGKKKRQA